MTFQRSSPLRGNTISMQPFKVQVDPDTQQSMHVKGCSVVVAYTRHLNPGHSAASKAGPLSSFRYSPVGFQTSDGKQTLKKMVLTKAHCLGHQKASSSLTGRQVVQEFEPIVSSPSLEPGN